MKQSIIKVTTCAFIISAITLFYTHQDVCGMELSRFTSYCRDEEPTQQDNDGGGVNYSNVYASNTNLYSIENNHTENSLITDNNAYTKTNFPTESIAFNNNVSNENSTNNTMAYNENYSAKESGPNNNYQDVTSADISNSESTSSTSNQPEELQSASNNNLSKEVGWSTKEITTTASSSAPPPPGGGGQDPFSAPFDDFYGLAFLLIASTIFGIFGLKKMKIG